MDPRIEKFIRRIQRRLNLQLLKRLSCYAFLLAACGLPLVCFFFIYQGHKVDRSYLVYPFLIALLFLLIAFILRRYSRSRAVHFADSFFELHEGLISSLAFQQNGRQGGIYDLQLKDTVERCQQSSASRINWRLPGRVLLAAAILFLLTGWLVTLDDSPAIIKRRTEEAENEKKSRDIKKKLEKQLEELKKELTPEEKKLFDRSKISERIKELQVTKDKKEALRQYARLEKELRNLATSMQFREDERFLAKMAQTLKEQQQSRKLGKKLAEKKYKDAAKMLEKMKAKDRQDLAKLKQQLEKLRQMSAQMQQAANELKNSRSQFRKSAGELNDATGKMSKMMKMMEGQMREGKLPKDAKQMMMAEMDKMNGELEKMGMQLGEHGTKAAFFGKMQGMMQGLMESQNWMLSQQESQGKGKGIGMGSVWEKNTEKNGDIGLDPTRIRGQKGMGPSEQSLEEAAFGTGVARVKSGARKSEYKYQMESFIKREDIPEVMKDGVKTYFRNIHKNTGEKNP